MSSFTYIVIQEYLSRSKQKYVLFISLTRVVSFKLFCKTVEIVSHGDKHFDVHCKIRTQIVPTYFWVIAINNGRHCFVLFLPMQSFYINTNTTLKF